MVEMDRRRKKLRIRRVMSDQRMSPTDVYTLETLLPKLAARLWAADHPELFGPHLEQALNIDVSRLPSTARAETVAPAVKDGSLENGVEHNGEASEIPTI